MLALDPMAIFPHKTKAKKAKARTTLFHHHVTNYSDECREAYHRNMVNNDSIKPFYIYKFREIARIVKNIKMLISESLLIKTWKLSKKIVSFVPIKMHVIKDSCECTPCTAIPAPKGNNALHTEKFPEMMLA